ncbi:MAG: fibronectin type III domain-containing protein [Candidatus Izemoplasmatales bacterium]|nr:fibronectin type III domain-containing protein [Candidatus Izemoplasmatales bacterium]
MANRRVYSSGVAHPNTRYWIDVIVEEIQKDPDNNRSLIFFDLRARSEYTWDLEFRGRLGYIDIDNGSGWKRIVSGFTDLAAYDGDGGAYNKRICTITTWVNHTSDGSLNLKVKGFYDYSNILISHKWWLSPVSVEGTYAVTKIDLVPTITVSIKERNAEYVSVSWKSNIPCKSIRCKYGNTNRSFTVSNAKSGTIKIDNLKPNTSYTFKIEGQSVANRYSPAKSLSAKTIDTTKITSSADLIFGSNLPIKKTNATTFKDDIFFYVNDILITKKGNIANTYTLQFTQAELDKMYKLFTRKNTANIKLTVVCKGSQNYEHTVKGVLLLTGNAKTAHIGINKIPRRAKVYVGVKKVARRAVVWVGTGKGNIRRTI